MITLLRRTLLCACLGALAVPAMAGASPGGVAPPGDSKEGFSAAAVEAAADPGCRARSAIAFREAGTAVDPRYRVRHASRIRCTDVSVRINCAADLFRGSEQISHLQDRGRDRCRIGSDFAQSQRYQEGTRFTQRYRYKLTLTNRRKFWTETTRKCPKRKNDRRTLICTSSHTTTAPKDSVDTISS